MDKKLPARPNLDHLRRQAKALLASLESGDADAAAVFREHLPAAGAMTVAQMRSARFRLADAQSAVARKNGFGSWPRLARHVEQLRSLEGTWVFERLEIDGTTVPPESLRASRLLMDGDRFRMESPEATYEGEFNIDVEAEPHRIDIEFIAGPEAGNTNLGVFCLEGDRLDLCLDMGGRSRPTEFRTTPGSGRAFETLRRSSATRPEAVTGGVPPARVDSPPGVEATRAQFGHVPSETLARLQGSWSAKKIVRDGSALPGFMLKTSGRETVGNEIKVTVGGMVMVHALVRIDETANPIAIDYFNIGGPATGSVQFGIMEWVDREAHVCMAPPGRPRPAEFECPAGSGRSLTLWRKKA